MSLTGKGSFRSMMDALVDLERTVAEPDVLRLSRWRPAKIEPPHLYNWMPNPAPMDWTSTQRVSDDISMLVRIAVRRRESDEGLDEVSDWIDNFREIIDPALHVPYPLNGTVAKATRSSTRLVLDTFDSIDYLAAEFVMSLDLARHVIP